MNKSNRLLSELVAYRTYAKHLNHLNRRETLEETLNRNLTMFLERYPKLSRDILKAGKQLHDFNVMPSMRSLQFGGEAIVRNNVRLFNCSFANITEPRIFAEALFLLLSGTGFGYSVQSRHINQLPSIKKPKEEGTYVVHDSIEGWAEALRNLTDSYFYCSIRPIFDFSRVRPKGSYLVTTGAKAPGPEPLRQMLLKVEEVLKSAIGRKLKTIEVHDIICLIADCVLSGGIRRAALISLFDRNDNDMLKSKHGSWWEKHPHRARANNSAVLPRAEVTHEEFKHVYDMCIASNAGEPGFFWTNNPDWGTNPCAEIGLQSHQFCNLTTTNLTGIKNEKDFHNRVYAAALLGTLQAGFTDFPYLSEKWKQVTENEALIGCSFTGIADSPGLSGDQLKAAARTVLEVNEKYARKIGINLSARTTAIKPEGTASCVVGSSSGVHARHSEYYLRRIRMNKDDELAKYLSRVVPELVEDDVFSKTGVVVTIPQESPVGAITRHQETALNLFDRVKHYYNNWILPGHRSGDNTHNVSCTINYKPEEVEPLLERLWNDRDQYAAVSLLPFSDAVYQQSPFEDTDKETFEKYNKMVNEIDLTKVLEFEDNTNRAEQLACTAGGFCEIT
jgi:ribonucleoside-triphosphate reductase (thioredoxin)